MLDTVSGEDSCVKKHHLPDTFVELDIVYTFDMIYHTYARTFKSK